MTPLYIFCIAILVADCGRHTRHVHDGINAEPCIVQPGEGGANIICPSSSTFIENGETGATGDPGVNGYTSLIKVLPSLICAAGGVEVISGLDLDRNNNLDSSEEQYSATICDGAVGPVGPAGDSPFTIVALIDVCGDAAGVYDEVFFKMQNGTIVASFSDNANGNNTRLSVLTNGNYITTDGSRCRFTVSDGLIINEHY